MATKTINKSSKVDIKNTVKDVNNFIVDTAELIVDEAFDRTAAWQGLTEKAIQGGFKLAKTQSDLTFKVLETLKKQWIKGQDDFVERVMK